MAREALLKGKAQYHWLPCNNQLRSAEFILKILLTFVTKQANLLRGSTVLCFPPPVSYYLLCLTTRKTYKGQARESLLKGKDQNSWPSMLTSSELLFIYLSLCIHIYIHMYMYTHTHFIFIFYKTTYLNEVNHTEPSLSVMVPCSNIGKIFWNTSVEQKKVL